MTPPADLQLADGADSANGDTSSGDEDGGSMIAVAVGTALGTAAVMGLAFVLHSRRSRAGERDRVPMAAAGPSLPPSNAPRRGGPEPVYNTIDERAVGRGGEAAYEEAMTHNPAYASAPGARPIAEVCSAPRVGMHMRNLALARYGTTVLTLTPCLNLNLKHSR